MGTLKLRAKINRVEGNRLYFNLPERAVSEVSRGPSECRAVDPANLKRDFLEISKAVYIGSKLRLRKEISSLVPGEVKTVFDPMCGFSHVLRELAAQGKTVWVNDINPIAYHYSRALFASPKPSEEECKAFVESVTKVDGFFSKSNYWPSAKIPIHFKQFIDGCILKAQESSHSEFFLGLMASYLSSVIRAFGGPYHPPTIHYFRIAPLRQDILNDAKELLKYNITGKVTNQNALSMEIPDVDMIYFDPPYKTDKEGGWSYVTRYKKVSSILYQADWDDADKITIDQIREFGKKLATKTDMLFISGSASCPVKWKSTLDDPRRLLSMKRFQLKGSGLANAARSDNKNRRILSEQVWISVKKSLAEIVKAQDPYMIYPPEDANYDYSMRIHFRGKSVHFDLLSEIQSKQYVIGWTLFSQLAGAIKEPVLTMQEGKKIVANSPEYFKIDLQTGEWKKRENTDTNVSIASARKMPEPHSQIEFQGVTPKGSEGTGATKNYPGVYVAADKGSVQYGANRTELHELFLEGKTFNGRYFFRQLKELDINKAEDEIEKEEGFKKGEPNWLFINPIDQVPNILSSKSVSDKWLPPKGVSALPKHWRSHVEDDEQYWKMDGAKALEAREALRKRLQEEGILAKAEKDAYDPWSKTEDVKKARHSFDHCMECTKPPEIEILWAEGRGHAWFCRACLIQWMKKELGWHDIDSAKEVIDGKASKKYSENTNPNIAASLKKYEPEKKAIAPADVGSLIPKAPSVAEIPKKKKKKKKKEDEEVKKQEDMPTDEFRIVYQWWKKVKTLGESPSKPRYHIWLRHGKSFLQFSVNDSILDSDTVEGILYKEHTSDEYEKIGYVKPDTNLNPTKSTPSFMKLLDRGEVTFLVDTPNLKKIEFKGSKLKGTFLFKNIESYWEIKRAR